MENSDILMVDENIVYSAKACNPIILFHIAPMGCFSIFLIWILSMEFFNIFDNILSLILCITILLSLLLIFFLEKKIISSWLRNKNSYLYITSRGIHWPCDKEYCFIAWNDVKNYDIYSDEGDALIITKNNYEKITINLNYFLPCKPKDIDAAIKKCIGNR